VFVLSAGNAEIGGGGFGVIKGVLRFDEGDLIVYAGFIAGAGEFDGLFIRGDGIVINFL
jgi:hypothetical protein